MPTKVTEHEVCHKIIERNREVLVQLRAHGKSCMAYDRARFRSDMRSKGFLTTTSVIDAKWEMLKADEIVIAIGTLTALDIPELYLTAKMPVPVAGRAGCVIDRDREIERDTAAQEGQR